MKRKGLPQFFALALFGMWAMVVLAACPAQAIYLPKIVKDIDPGAASSYPSDLTVVNGILFFIADNGTAGRELWKSDGTSSGTSMVKDITPGQASSDIRGLKNVNGTLFFVLNKEDEGVELWKSDGTEGGTVKAAGPFEWLGRIGNPLALYPLLQNVGDKVYFCAKDATGYGLWKYDCSNKTTALVKGDLMVVQLGVGRNNILYFTAIVFDVDYYARLWRTDGTTGGTDPIRVQVDEYLFTWLLPGLDADTMAVMNGTLFLSADSAWGGTWGVNQELWMVDGSETISRVSDIHPGTAGSEPHQLTVVKDTLFFTADDGTAGRELWACKRRPPPFLQPYSVYMVKDIFSGATSSDPKELTALNGTLFFTAKSNNSQYLYKSDGTLSGTVRVKKINPLGDYPNYLTGSQGNLFFANNDGMHGWQLWVSDGTESGTWIAANVNPGGGHSWPDNLTDFDGTLFFVAENGTYGRELWKLLKIDKPDPRKWILANLFEKKYYKGGSVRLRTDLLNIMGEVNSLISQGEIAQAVRKLQEVRRHVDGSGHDDWVVDKTAQSKATAMIDGLIADLDSIRQ